MGHQAPFLIGDVALDQSYGATLFDHPAYGPQPSLPDWLEEIDFEFAGGGNGTGERYRNGAGAARSEQSKRSDTGSVKSTTLWPPDQCRDSQESRCSRDRRSQVTQLEHDVHRGGRSAWRPRLFRTAG